MPLLADAVEALGGESRGGFVGELRSQVGENLFRLRELLEFVKGVTQLEHRVRHLVAGRIIAQHLAKLGYTHYELKQFAEAKAVLQELREKFPKATAARLAAKRLDRIRKEGH